MHPPPTLTKSAPDSVPSAPPPPDNDFEPEVSVEDGFEIEVRKAEKKKNRRVIRSWVRVDADLETVWGVLTDYEGLGGFYTQLGREPVDRQGREIREAVSGNRRCPVCDFWVCF